MQQPELAQLVDRLVGHHDSVTVVPLLLSYGFHLEVDVAAAIAPHPNARSTGQLGPHPVLADVLADRLTEAGARSGEPVVLAVAGSSRPAARHDAEQMRQLLSSRWGGSVGLGFLSAVTPTVADALLDSPAAAVAAYLIGPGFFQRKLAQVAAEVGTACIAQPLGADPRLADLVVAAYRAG
ncbi:hypothetical protein GCM10027579_10420 [Calidifontibacter terrae]